MSAPKQIRRVPNISYDEFRQQHLLPNQPLLVGPDLIQEWNCLNYWRLSGNSMDSKGSHEMDGECSLPNLPFMKEAYGDFVVPVDEYGCRSEKTLREVIDIWESGQGDAQEEKMYVKDWHLALQLERRQQIPQTIEEQDREEKKIEHMPFYMTPDIFVDDWMNRYYLAKTQDDFRFVYMGPAGTFTRLHRDVYTSYSWSTNIVGRKRWWLFPPHVTEFITNAHGDTVADDVLLDEYHSENLLRDKKWPHWNIAREAMYVVEQEEGETIFVPSGWYHQVLNLTFCISINHNWSNAHNLQSMHQAMVQATRRVEHSIEDVKELLQKQHPQEWEQEWTTVVQDLLRQDAGWDWSTFWAMVLLNLEDAVSDENDTQPYHQMDRDTKEMSRTEPEQNMSTSIDENENKETTASETVQETNKNTTQSRRVHPSCEYVQRQITPCLVQFTTESDNNSWGQDQRYADVLARIYPLLQGRKGINVP